TTNEGVLPFQEYFVQRKCQPRVSGFNFMNIERSEPAPGVLHALQESDLVVICPSNPWVSIDPILAVPTLKSALSSRPIVGVSPIIGGKAVKGPAARMYRELGIQPSALAVAQHYQNLITGFVFDTVDVAQDDDIRKLDIHTLVTDTLMKTSSDRRRLAQDVLQFYEGMIVSSKKFGGKA
ncbi:MAG: YvcK family protein, partial [Chloroflexi bacterium]|nr:YvcK family protein [Chloroflexota bacterium]